MLSAKRGSSMTVSAMDGSMPMAMAALSLRSFSARGSFSSITGHGRGALHLKHSARFAKFRVPHFSHCQSRLVSSSAASAPFLPPPLPPLPPP